MKRALSIPYTFVMLNWAAMVGCYYFMRGVREVWNPQPSGE